MATNKKPNKHKPSINPLIKAKMEASFREENEKAKTAGVEYGILAMKIATIMYLENSGSKLKAMMGKEPDKDFIEYIAYCRDIILQKKPIIDMIKSLQEKGYTTSVDRLVEIDPSLGQYM